MPDKKDFISLFKSETEEHLTKLDKGLVKLEKDPRDLNLIKDLKRAAHTIKGSARVFEYDQIQDIAHAVEDVFDKLTEKEISFTSEIADVVFEALDIIRVVLGEVVKEEPIDIDPSEICAKLAVIADGEEKRKNGDSSRARSARLRSGQEGQPPGDKDQEARGKEDKKSESAVSEPTSDEFIRVPTSRVNKLLNLVGEMVINKMKSSSKIAQSRKIFVGTKDMQKRIAVLSEKVKNFLPPNDVEITKLFGQCSADVHRLNDEASELYKNISTEAFQLDPIINELQDKMKEIRMLPCSTVFEMFPRMIRDIASRQGKKVDLDIRGEETELDKKVLEGIKAPLMHILRNCIDHGIEPVAKRKDLGKPAVGKIEVSAFHDSGNVVIKIEDDGGGIDVNQIRQTVIKKHLVSETELKTMTEKEILNLIFMNGYSTSPIITDVSGRGVGLDVVRHDIDNLRGQVVLDTLQGKGTTFEIVLPLTIAIIQVLLVKSRGELFAMPVSSIEESLEVHATEISTLEGRMAVQVHGHSVPVVKLDELLGLPAETEERQSALEELPVVVTSSMDKKVGFIVDEIVGGEEIFIKSLGKHLGKLNNVMGATILGTGEVVVILDIPELIVCSRLSHPAIVGRQFQIKEKRKDKKVLIVEDALSTREVERSILEGEGYQVDTAVDGVDALDKVAVTKYDLVVTDVQMPRMDGFELCEAIRKNPEYDDVPVVVVTALEKEEDKRRGINSGAQAYIVKSAFDQGNLLDTIERLIG